MSQKNIIIALSALIVMLVGLIFMVKKNATSQAQEFVKKTQEQTSYQIGQVKDNIENNNLLWSIIDSIWKSPDKSIASVKRLADSQKLPRCKGKACAGDDARLRTTITTNAGERSIKVGWSKYSFVVYFDPKAKGDRFSTIDVNDLLGKSQDTAAEEEYEEASEEAAAE
jgi:hypothetical protein